MPTILALDATSESCSVSLANEFDLISLCSDAPRSHAQKLLPMVDQLLSQADIGLQQIDAIAYGCGPGSFTGLRIGLGVAQGLAYGLEIPIIGVGSLESMALAVARQPGYSGNTLMPVLDARMNEVYWAVYDIEWIDNNPLPVVRQEPRLTDPVTAAREFTHCGELQTAGLPMMLVGAAGGLLPDDILGDHPIRVTDTGPLSAAVAHIATGRLARNLTNTASDAELTYLRNSVSWNKRKRIRT